MFVKKIVPWKPRMPIENLSSCDLLRYIFKFKYISLHRVIGSTSQWKILLVFKIYIVLPALPLFLDKKT